MANRGYNHPSAVAASPLSLEEPAKSLLVLFVLDVVPRVQTGFGNFPSGNSDQSQSCLGLMGDVEVHSCVAAAFSVKGIDRRKY